jgi:hypothetical protein
MSEGLVKGEGFAIDASIIRADASPARGVPGTGPIDWGCVRGQNRAVREYLDDLHAWIIVDVEATPTNRTHEVESTRTMIDRVERRHDLIPRRLAGLRKLFDEGSLRSEYTIPQDRARHP